MSAYCPLLVVPPTQDGDPAGPVLLGVGPATPSEVVSFAFARAQDQGAELLAVRTRHDVRATARVVDDGCTPLLAALAARARLLVVGRPARGAAPGRLRPSPALTPARHAPCPVVVVAPEGPTGRTLLPRRRVGRADLRV